MRKTKGIEYQKPLTVSMMNFPAYINSGYATARKVAEDAGAIITIGSRKFVNLKKVQNYIDSISE